MPPRDHGPPQARDQISQQISDQSPAQSTVPSVELAHALRPTEVLEQLDVDAEDGLSGPEAARRLEEHGPNRLPEPPRDNAVVRFIRHFNDVLIYVLLGAAVLTIVLQQWVDTVVILIVVLINALVGFIQEGRAQKALEGIRQMLSPTAGVRRDGARTTIDADELVLGDIVTLAAGDKVPADVRLLEAADVAAEESALTGESVPATKSADPVEEGAELGDRSSMVFSSTLITSGAATGVVVATGAQTQIGQINTMVSEVETLQTPLTRQISRFSVILSVVVLVVAVAMVLVGWFVHGTPVNVLLLSAVGFAVAAIPEGLPALITITLALGVQAMARRNAITRKLPAVQTLGSVTTICSDKTGTLTRNEMTVEKVVSGGREFEVTGTGYAPEGAVHLDGSAVDLGDAGLRRLVQVMSLANDTELTEQDGRWGIAGEPTEGALQSLAGKLGFDPADGRRLATLPFSSAAKLMAVTAELPGGLDPEIDGPLVLVKGAPDRLLDRSSRQLGTEGRPEDLDRNAWETHIDRLGDQGLRVLAAAARPARDQDTENLGEDDLGEDLVFVGLVGIVDPPREEAITAVATCRQAGIQVKMITGDHAGTATAIARQMGIDDGAGAISGSRLEEADDQQLSELAERHHVFARTSPEHKLRLVRALQSQGEVVAMTGDGVNDAPALRRADVGVAMGIKGTEVTKESAEVVLADDNFATIETAVEEGRRIYDNLRKAIVFLLPTNGAQSLVILSAVLLGWTLPLTPLQVLWVNMVTAVTLAFAFAFEPAEPGLMDRSPQDPDAGIVGARHLVQIAVVSLLIAGASIGSFVWSTEAGYSLEHARTLATTVLVVCQVFYLFNVKVLHGTTLRRLSVLFNNRVLWLLVAVLTVLQLLFVYWSPLHAVFGTTGLPLEHLLVTTAVGLGVFLATELVKLVLYANHRHMTQTRGKDANHHDHRTRHLR